MWFLVVSALAFSGYALFMRKNLTRVEMVATSFFVMALQDNVDIYLDLKLDLYGYFEKGAQWGTLITVLGIYPAVNIIFLNYYPFERSLAHKITYVGACSIFALAYEWAAVQSGYFYHHGWKYWYSAICYPVLFYILVLMLKWVRKLENHQAH